MPEQMDPIQGAMEGMMQSVESDMQAADMIAEMGNKQAADLLRESAKLKGQALQMLNQGGGNDMQGADTAGTNAMPMNMATRG